MSYDSTPFQPDARPSFGPHRFRHAIATTAALCDPGSPGLAAGLLGITGQVLEEHYNRAGQNQAAIMFDKAITSRRERLRRAAGGKGASHSGRHP
jgi:integrase